VFLLAASNVDVDSEAPWRPTHCNLLGSYSYSTGKRFQQKSNKNAGGTDTENEHGSCGTVLGDLDAGVQARMQVINQVFKRRIEQFSCQHQATVEQQQCPPDHCRLAPGEHDHDHEGGNALQAKARFQTQGGGNAAQGKSHALEKGLVLHGARGA
jgi:hypothetical protein